jgi:hypothetical protein
VACKLKYLNIVGAGLCGTGSAITIFVGGGTPLTLAAILSTIGSLSWLTASIADLIQCLRRKGLNEQADKLQEHLNELEREMQKLERLRDLVS